MTKQFFEMKRLARMRSYEKTAELATVEPDVCIVDISKRGACKIVDCALFSVRRERLG